MADHTQHAKTPFSPSTLINKSVTIEIPKHASSTPPAGDGMTAPSSNFTHSNSLQQLYPAPTPPLPETPSVMSHHQLHEQRLSSLHHVTSPTSMVTLTPITAPSSSASTSNSTSASTTTTTNIAQPSASATTSTTALSTTPPKIAWRRKLVLVLVGLPARGKSYIAYKLLGYLRWRGLNASLFNVGKHRRHVAEKLAEPQDAAFFSADNLAAKAQRDEIAMEVLECMLDWLAENGDVSIFDATNTTAARRKAVLAHCQGRSPDLRVIFLESICDDARVLENNYKVKVANSPDYKNMSQEDALKDLRMRVANYEKIYESIDDDELSYIKLHNLASKVICNKIHGQLSHAIAAYLMSIHVAPRPIYFVRAGHSESDRDEVGQQYEDRQILKLPDTMQIPNSSNDFHIPYTVAMAANLDNRGKSFASRLSHFITNKVEEYLTKREQEERDLVKAVAPNTNPTIAPTDPTQTSSSSSVPTTSMPVSQHPPLTHSISASDPHLPLVVYTSTLPRAIQTAAELKERAYIFEPQSSLNMMDTGVCSGMSISEIRERMPQELERWQRHKYKYRFPGGESQADRAKSLEPLVFELERQTLPVLVVSHMSTLQVLMGFFYGSKRSVDSYYSLWIPQHTVLELIPHQYGWSGYFHDLSEEACASDEDHLSPADATHPAVTLPASPKQHPVAIPVELGTANEEVERFNLQVVERRPSSDAASISAAIASISSSASSTTSGATTMTTALSQMKVSQPSQLHDRSFSIPPQAQSPSSSSTTTSTGDKPVTYRKGSMGRSSNVNLGETNFYDEP